MSHPPRPARAEPRIERLQPRIAAAASILLHALVLLLATRTEPVTMTSPSGGAAGGRIEVTYVDPMLDIPPPPRVAPPVRPVRPTPPRQTERAPAPTPLRTTLVDLADEPEASGSEARPQAATPPHAPPVQRPPRHVWGQPPGMLPRDHAPVNAGRAPSPATDRGRRSAPASSGPSLEVGGFHVIYDVLSEAKVQAWQDQGMTEVYLPLPGVRSLMACPLETVARRGSGPCRLVEPDDPALAGIGDAREVVTLYRVYRRGDLVWQGPGAYR